MKAGVNGDKILLIFIKNSLSKPNDSNKISAIKGMSSTLIKAGANGVPALLAAAAAGNDEIGHCPITIDRI